MCVYIFIYIHMRVFVSLKITAHIQHVFMCVYIYCAVCCPDASHFTGLLLSNLIQVTILRVYFE